MASLVRLDALRTASKQAADQENSSFLSDSEWNANINRSATRLYNKLATVFEEYYWKNVLMSLTPGTQTYQLPADFFKLGRIDEITSGSAVLNPTTGLYELNGQATTVKPYLEMERNRYTQFTGSRSLVFNYIPVMPALSIDSDTFDGVNGFEEWIILDAAIKAYRKEESVPQDLRLDRDAIWAELDAIADNRDAGHPLRMVDVYSMDPYDFVHIPSRLRYKVLGQNIQFVQSFAYGTTQG